MRNFYFIFKSRPSGSKAKVCFAIFIFTTICLKATAQNFTSITWETAASQKFDVSEAQGRVVKGKLYSFGGFDSRKSTFTPTKRAYVYDPMTNTWTSIADLPHSPNGTDFGGITHAGITTDGADIFIAGGYTSNPEGTGQIFGTKQVWKYLISQNIYIKLPDLPITVAAGQLEYLDGQLHYIGGTNPERTVDLGDHFVLDLKNLAAGWKTLAPLPNPRQHAGSAVYGGKIYFIGGQHHHDADLVTQKDVHVFDPAKNSWTKLADIPVPEGANGRAHISSGVVVMGDRIIVLGGEIAHQANINMVSAFSPATNSWINLTPLPENRFSGVAGVMTGDIFYTGGSKTKTTFKGTPQGVILSSAPIVSTAPSVAENNLKKPLVYPNPLKAKLNIRFPASYSGNFSFTITNQNGINYNIGDLRLERGGANASFDISMLPLRAGVYFLKISSYVKSDELKLIIK